MFFLLSLNAVYKYWKLQKWKTIFWKKIKSKIVKAAIVFYYLYICASCILYIYESISINKNNGSYIMAAGAAIMLNVINQSICKLWKSETGKRTAKNDAICKKIDRWMKGLGL